MRRHKPKGFREGQADGGVVGNFLGKAVMSATSESQMTVAPSKLREKAAQVAKTDAPRLATRVKKKAEDDKAKREADQKRVKQVPIHVGKRVFDVPIEGWDALTPSQKRARYKKEADHLASQIGSTAKNHADPGEEVEYGGDLATDAKTAIDGIRDLASKAIDSNFGKTVAIGLGPVGTVGVAVNESRKAGALEPIRGAAKRAEEYLTVPVGKEKPDFRSVLATADSAFGGPFSGFFKQVQGATDQKMSSGEAAFNAGVAGVSLVPGANLVTRGAKAAKGVSMLNRAGKEAARNLGKANPLLEGIEIPKVGVATKPRQTTQGYDIPEATQVPRGQVDVSKIDRHVEQGIREQVGDTDWYISESPLGWQVVNRTTKEAVDFNHGVDDATRAALPKGDFAEIQQAIRSEAEAFAKNSQPKLNPLLEGIDIPPVKVPDVKEFGSNPKHRIDHFTEESAAMDNLVTTRHELFDPSSKEFDKTLSAAGFKHYTGESPKSMEELKSFWQTTYDAFEDTGDKAYRPYHRDDLMGEGFRAAKSSIEKRMDDSIKYDEDALNYAIGSLKSDTATGGVVRMYKKHGDWYADRRTPTNFTDVGTLEPGLRAQILDFMDSQPGSDNHYLWESEYHAWRSQGKGSGHSNVKFKTAEEVAYNELDPVEAREIGPGEVPIHVPTKIVNEFIKQARNKIRFTKRSEELARYGAKPEDIEAVKDYYTGGKKTSYAKQVTERKPLPGTNPQKVFDDGQEAIKTGRIDPDSVIKRVNDGGATMDETEIGATLAELTRLKAYQKTLEEGISNPETLDEWMGLQEKIEKYHQAGDLTANQWHKIGQALQIATRDDMSLGALTRRAKFLNNNQKVDPVFQKKLDDLSKKYNDALAEMEKLKQRPEELIEKVKRYQGTERFSQKSKAQAVSTAKSYFQGAKVKETSGGFGGNRKRGAVQYTISNDEMKARSAVRKLAKEAALDGAETLDEVLDSIRNDIGVDVPDEQLLSMIYEPYSKYRIEADVARIQANNALNDVKRAAEFRALPAQKKFGRIVAGTLNGVQRSFQAGADFSAPLIQGRKGIFANPIGWVKAYAPMMRAAFSRRKNNVAIGELAKIEQHPMFAKSKAAGLELATPGGRFTQQEEMFAGNIGQILEHLEGNRGIKRVAGAPLEAHLNILQRSEDAYTTYMNALRYDTFTKMAKVAPNDPEYLKDVAQIINVIYGRGTGKLAKAAGDVGGEVFFAPRYLVSNIQYQSGVPFWKANTTAGRLQAAKIYAAHTAAVPSLMALASLAGWEVGNDPRSSSFGKISKGGVTIDLAGKDTQFVRLAAQMLYGKVNASGKFTEPSNMAAATGLGQFIQGKLAPAPRMAAEKFFGVYDDKTGKTRPTNVQDWATKPLPLWVQDLVKESDNWEGRRRDQFIATLVNIFGAEVKPKDIKKGNPPPIKPLQVGIGRKDQS